MANNTELKNAIAQVIKANGNQEITGQVLQNTLNSIISSIGSNATFAGIAIPTTSPGTPDQNVFYFAVQAGTYVNFGGLEVKGGFNIIKNNASGNWVLSNVYELVEELGDSETAVINQKAVTTELVQLRSDLNETTDKLTELESEVSKTYNGNYTKSDFSDNYMIDVNGNIITNDYFRVLKKVSVSNGDIVKAIGVTSDNPNVCCIAAYSANGDFLSNKSVFVQYATTYHYEVGTGVAYLAFGALLTTSNVSVTIERPTALSTLRSDIEILDSNITKLNQGEKITKQNIDSIYVGVEYDVSDFEDNLMINTNGQVVTNTYYRVLKNVIPVLEGYIIETIGVKSDNPNICCIAAYDADGNFLNNKSIFLDSSSTKKYVVSEGVAYLSFGTLLTIENVNIAINKSTAILTLKNEIENLKSGLEVLNYEDFIEKEIFIESNGKEVFNSEYITTDFILISGIKKLSVVAVMGNLHGGGIAFYDRERKYISSLYNKTTTEIAEYIVNLEDIPSEAWYIKVQGRKNRENISVSYYVATNAETNALIDYNKQALWQKAKSIYSNRAESLSTNEYIILEDSPNIRNSYVIQASAIIRAMGRLRISKGTGAYAAGIVDIDTTNIYEYNPNNPTAYNTYEHGVNISDFIRITIKVDAMPMTAQITGKARLILESVGGRYEKEIMWNGGNNNVVFLNASANLGISELTMSVKGKDVWYFGDSYLDFWTPFAYKMGANNILIDGFSGRASEAAYISLLREIKVNLPKKIVWGMGMNDGDSSDAVNATWKYYYEQLIILCNKYGIEPILVTIPNTPTVTNYYKNEIIRASGYRYLDIAAIMGANEKGSAWYSGLLSGDNVHPKTLGSEIIATYIVAQLAEIVV